MNIENAEEYLSKNLLCHIDEPFTLTHLISVLFHITQLKAIPLPAIEAIRAVAFILKQHEASDIAKLASEHIINILTPKIAEHVVAAIAPQVAKILTTSEHLEDTMKEAERLRAATEREREERRGEMEIAADRIDETVNTLHDSLDECKEALKNISPTLDKANDRLNDFSQRTDPPSTPSHTTTVTQPQYTKPSYSTIAAAHLPPSVDQALARTAIRARQIILDPLPGGNMFPPETTHAEIVKLLKESLKHISDDTTPHGDIRAVTTFRNGGLLVELENEPLATWLRKPLNRNAMAGKLGPTVSFRSSAFPIVIEYLPIHTQITEDKFLRKTEEENNLPENSLISAKWIKPIDRRSQTQRKAFMLLQVIDAPTANLIIKNGVCISNERFTTRKDKKEPFRCAKCQKFGHIARNCTAPTDTCGTCGNQHRTSDCNAYKSEHCTNCKTNDHTSWNRRCPEFKRRLETLNDNFPENRMPYYPTETPWTQIANLPRTNRAQPQPPPPSEPNKSAFSSRPLTHFTQSKLNYQKDQSRRQPPTPRSQPQTQPISQILTNLPPLTEDSESSSEHNSSWFDA
jgi:hypothetical protein